MKRLPLALVVWTGLLILTVGALGTSVARGDPGSGDPAPAEAGTGRGHADAGAGSGGAPAAQDPPKLVLLQGGSTCEGCDPDRTEIELVFTSPVNADGLAGQLKIEPPVRLEPTFGGELRRILLKAEGNLEPQTRYHLTAPEGLCASDGACLLEPYTFSIRTGGGYPQVRMPIRNTVIPPGRKLPMRFSQVEKATLRLVPIRPAELPRALGLVGVHPADKDVLSLLPPEARKRAHVQAIDVTKSAPDGSLEVDPFNPSGGEPLVLAVLSGKGTTTKVGLYQRGELAALVKLGDSGGLVWVADTATGEPVRGAAVAVLHGLHTTYRGSTDQNGLLRLPARSQLRRKDVKTPVYALIRKDGKAAVTGTDWDESLSPWMFDLPYYYYSGSEAIRGMISAERGIYRPGEQVHILGILRRKLPDGTLAPPYGSADVKVKDPDGTVVHQQAARLTAFGTVRLTFTVPSQAPVGRYYAELTKDGATLYHSFEVGDFKAASFEVELSKPGPAELDGDDIVVPLSARYLYGSPVAGGKVEWSVSWRHRRLHFAGLEDYDFDGDHYYFYRNPQYLTSGKELLGADGRAVLHIPKKALPSQSQAQVIDLIVEATVTDAADDTITGHTVKHLNLTEALVGIGSKQWVVSPQAGWDVQVVALDPQGQPLAGKEIHLELKRTYYNTVAEKGPHGVRYRTTRENSTVATRTITSSSSPQPIHLDIVGGGDYELTAYAEGQGYKTRRQVWAYGKAAVGALYNTPHVTLQLDKDSYKPGDVAQIFAALPYAKSTALITMERGGVMKAQVVELNGADKPARVKIEPGYLPNVYVGVAALPRGAGQASPASGYPFRVGYKEIRVSPESRRLKLTVEPAERSLEPGDQATVKVRVLDHQSRPVSAEVTVWAADEGVLMLTGYQTPDPFSPAYAGHPLTVTSALNLSRWTNYDPVYWNDGGGDYGAGGSALRSRMLHTAFFSGGVTTNGAGEATVRFKVPDNLTRWRIMAVAADRGQRFGRTESAITVSKPLQVLPALPRFVTEGDLVDAGFVIHNRTGGAATAEVSLQVAGADLVGKNAGKKKLQLASGAQQAVRFPLVVRQPGQVTLSISVRAGQHTDGLRLSLPAHQATIEQSTVLEDGKISGKLSRWISIPSGARVDSPELLITASPSLLSSLEAGVGALLEYPYGCAEQKTSRLIPMVLLGDLIKQLSLAELDEEQHRARLQSTIGELEQHQNDDGGFGLWVESDTDTFITAYVLWGMLIARQHGYRVHNFHMDEGLRYLQRQIKTDELGEGYFSFDPDVFVAYVLALAGETDHGLGAKLFEKQDDLSRFEKGLLAAALVKQDGVKAAALLAELDKGKDKGKKGGSVISDSATGTYFDHGRDLRATAAAVTALVAAGRAADAEPLVAGILGLRRGDGTWGTTFNNLWGVYALGAYAAAAQAPSPADELTVKLNGTERGRLRFASALQARRLVIPAAALPAPGGWATLQLQAPDGSSGVFYTARLRFTTTAKAQTPLVTAGYELRRELLDADTGQAVTQPKVGQLLRVRLHVDTNGYRHQVALTDRLPAGLEPVNTRLKTSQQQVQAQSGWSWRSAEVHDERVSFFAYGLSSGSYAAEYLARASRSGEFVWPAATAESMYDPDEHGRGSIDHLVVTR